MSIVIIHTHSDEINKLTGGQINYFLPVSDSTHLAP